MTSGPSRNTGTAKPKATGAPVEKRANGEGSWKLLPNRTWEYRISIKFLDNTKKRCAFYAATKTECREQATAAQDAAGATVTSDRQSVETFVVKWLAAKRRTGEIKPRTADFYEDHIRKYIVPGLGGFDITALKSWHIQAWLDGQLDAGLGVPTVQGMWRTLRAALSRAKQLRVVAENEASGDFIKLPRHTPKPAKHLEPSEFVKFLEAVYVLAESPRHYDSAAATMLLVAVTTGLRNAELIGLTWDDVTLRDDADGTPGTITVRQTLQRVRDPDASPRLHTNGRVIRPKILVVGPPKSTAGLRRVPLFPEAATLLRAERDRQRLARWAELPEGDLVFRTRYGKPMTDAALAKRMNHVCRTAGVDHRSFYALRHTAASAAIAAGESDVSVAQLLGHSDPATTKQIYARAFEERSTERMSKMRALLLGSQSTAPEQRPPYGAEEAAKW